MSTTMAPPPDAGTPNTPALSEGQRIINIFANPSATFADIKRSAAWWAPYLLISVFACIFVVTMQKKIGFEQVVENMKANMSEGDRERVEQMPPAQRANMDKYQLAGVKYFSYAFPIAALVFALIASAILLAIYNFGLGAHLSYGRTLAVWFYSSVPSILKTVLAVITMFVIDPGNFNLENPVVTNPGALVDHATHPALATLLGGLDIFTLWFITLLGIGFSVAGNVKRKTSLTVMYGVYFAILLCRTAWAAR